MIKTFTLSDLLLLTLFLPSACASTSSPPVSGFVHPDPETYVNLAPVVWEFFFYRKTAVISGNMSDFYDRYPNLSSGEDLEQGINAEAFQAAAFQGFVLVDGDVFPEYYEPFRVKIMPDHIEILVHGIELYLYRDAAGNLNQSGGEFKIVLFLRPDGEGWTLYRTDEVTLAEWKDFSP